VLVNHPKGKPRIWYPDFYLPEFGIYIEYFGLSGRQSYDRGVKRKDSTYSTIGLDVIPIYPWNFSQNWKAHIMNEIKRTTTQRYRKLMSKPYWNQKRFSRYHSASNTQGAYRNRTSRPY
jgi:hypothetical protein